MNAAGHDKKSDGVALISALAFLLLFSMLGTAYLRFMMIELDEARYRVNRARAAQLAESALLAVAAKIEAASRNTNQDLSGEYEIELPVYLYHRLERTQAPHTIHVTVLDESSRVNINSAPPVLLQALGFNEEQTAELAESIRMDGPVMRWRELRTRGILDPETHNQLNSALFTVFAASGPPGGQSTLNLNTAPPEVLAAVFNIPLTEAETLVGKRPFTSWQDVVTKTGRDPGAYNVQPDPLVERRMPSSLGLESRLYRLVAEARLDRNLVPGPETSGRVEAVLDLGRKNGLSFTMWTGSAAAAAAQPPEPAPAQPETARNPA